jgi:hypothetical protein
MSAAGLAALVLPGCGGGGGGGNSGPINRGVLRPEAVVLPTDGSVIVSDLTDTSLTLAGLVPAIVVGSVVASGIGAGFLRRVTDVQVVGGETLLQTENAVLTDLFESASFQETRSLTPDDFASIETHIPGVTFTDGRGRAEGNDFLFTFDGAQPIEFSDGSPVTMNVELSGSVGIDLDLDFAFEIDSEGLKEFRCLPIFRAVPTVSLKIAQKFTLETPDLIYATAIGNPVLFFVGAVPVVVVPIMTLAASLEGSFEVGIEFSCQWTATAKAGPRFSRGAGWSLIHEWTPNGNTTINGNLYASLSAQLNMCKAKLSADVYGLAGPFIKANMFSPKVELRADVNPAQVGWKLLAAQDMSAGLEANNAILPDGLGVSLEAFKNEVLITGRTFLPGSGNVGIS